MRQGERNEGSRSLYSPSDLAGEEIQSPCTPDSQKAAGRNLTCLPLVPPRFEPSRSLGRGSVQVSVFPLPNSPRSSDFSPHRRGKDEGGEEGGRHRGNELAPSARDAADWNWCAAPLISTRRWHDGVRRPGDGESAGESL